MSSEKAAEKDVAVSTKRMSHMSIEPPMSPVSASSDDSISTATASRRQSRELAENHLTPYMSHASSTGAVGGIVPTRTLTWRSAGTTGSFNPAFEIDYDDDDLGNPRNFSTKFKGMILLIMSLATTCVVLYSTSYASAIPGMMSEFGISDNTGILGVTTYLLGIATGAVILAPLSEMYGRRPIYLVALMGFIILVIPCALAKNIETILVIRFFGAFCASAMISNAPGTVNDIVEDEYRALAFSIWSIGPLNGPCIGGIVGGMVFQYLGWRWTNWVVIIATGAAYGLVLLVPETYTPALLRKRAKQRRVETGDSRWWSRYDDKESFVALLKVNLSRPFVLTVTEPILIFWDIYIALVYGILYLCFVAYPIVFTDIRGWSPGYSGLAFLGIGIGSTLVILVEPLLRRMINAHAPDPATGKPPPEAMVSVVCIAAILMPLGEIWFAWTCTPNVHWIWPILAGIPFGAGNGGVFIYATNYLVHSYGTYAASALAGNAVLRSIMGATLPLAGPALYRSLGANWAGTLLGLLEAACIPIPFIFYKYGHVIRQKSGLIRSMQEEERRMEEKMRRAEERVKRRAEAEVRVGGAMGTGAAVGEADLERKAVERREEAVEKRDFEV